MGTSGDMSIVSVFSETTSQDRVRSPQSISKTCKRSRLTSLRRRK